MFTLLVVEPHVPRGALVRGALLGAVGFEVLKSLANLLLAQTRGNPAFQAFGVALILLVWINYFSRLVMYAAAWAYTSPDALAQRTAEAMRAPGAALTVDDPESVSPVPVGASPRPGPRPTGPVPPTTTVALAGGRRSSSRGGSRRGHRARSAPMSGPTYDTFDVPVDGGDLRVGRWTAADPDAPVVLAAHGVTANHLSWQPLGALDRFTVVAPDLRGRGRSNGLAGPAGHGPARRRPAGRGRPPRPGPAAGGRSLDGRLRGGRLRRAARRARRRHGARGRRPAAAGPAARASPPSRCSAPPSARPPSGSR